MRRFLGLVLVVVAGSAWAGELPFEVVRQDLRQGGFLVGSVRAGERVSVLGREVAVATDGTFVVGFDREAPRKTVVEVCRGEACTSARLVLEKRVYKVQNVKGVPPKTVTPSKTEQRRMEADNAAIGKARAAAWWAAVHKGGILAFARAFSLPIEAETSGVYGSSRTYNGEERSWHKGHDLAGVTGTLVRAPADGVVRLARDTFMSGNLIMLDHGGGVTSVYAHLSRMQVAVGEVVKRGQVIGRVGTTGRSTGPHLHWGMYWREVAIDPILWVE